jgi:hypothetical protein
MCLHLCSHLASGRQAQTVFHGASSHPLCRHITDNPSKTSTLALTATSPACVSPGIRCCWCCCCCCCVGLIRLKELDDAGLKEVVGGLLGAFKSLAFYPDCTQALLVAGRLRPSALGPAENALLAEVEAAVSGGGGGGVAVVSWAGGGGWRQCWGWYSTGCVLALLEAGGAGVGQVWQVMQRVSCWGSPVHFL